MRENKILNSGMINRFFDGFTKYERTICSLLGFFLYQLIFWQARKKFHSPSKSSTSHKLSSAHVDSPILLPFPRFGMSLHSLYNVIWTQCHRVQCMFPLRFLWWPQRCNLLVWEKYFMLHVPLHITKVIDVSGVSLWVSSVCWDTK